MGLENPLLDAARTTVQAAALAAGLAASGCVLSPLDDITPTTQVKPSEVERMDAGSDAAIEHDAGQTPSDAGTAEDAATKDAGSLEPSPAGTGGAGGQGGTGGGRAPSAGTGGGAGEAAGAAGSAQTPEQTDKAIEETTRQYFDRIGQRTAVRCDCFPDAPDRSACNWNAPRKPHVDCMARAFQDIGESALDPLQCASDVELDWLQCYEQAECTEESIGTCNQTNLAERVACALPASVFVDRCIGVYSGITALDGFMQRASAFVQRVCRCNPDGTIDETATCSDTWHADTSPMTLDCVANNVYGIEARSLEQEGSPAISLLLCVNDALGAYAQCMDELAADCDPAGQEQCSEELTARVTDACGAQGIGIFTCISPM